MNMIRFMVATFILVLGVSAGSIYAAETSGSASADFMSNYVWRGQKLSNGMVIQPYVGITYGGFGANLWANYDNSTNEHNETDLTLNYTYSIDKLSLDGGYIFYALDGAEDTQELYVSASYDVLLSPSVALYADFDEGEGAFIVASIGHSFELAQKLTLDLGASLSYNADNAVMGTDSDGDEFSNFYNGDISASLSVSLTDAISAGPMVAYTFPLSGDAEDAIEAISDDGDSDLFYGGVNISLSF